MHLHNTDPTSTSNSEVPTYGTVEIQVFFIVLSILTAIFPCEPGLAGYTAAKDDGGGEDNWNYKTCKAPVNWSPPINQHRAF